MTPIEIVEVGLPPEVVEVSLGSDTEIVEIGVGTAEVIEVGMVGPAGPAGASGTGGTGTGGARYVHTQAQSAAEWIVDHMLGVDPAGLIVKDSGGTEVIGEVFHETTNRLRVKFTTSFGGKAVVS